MFVSCFRKIVESVGCGVECVETVEAMVETVESVKEQKVWVVESVDLVMESVETDPPNPPNPLRVKVASISNPSRPKSNHADSHTSNGASKWRVHHENSDTYHQIPQKQRKFRVEFA